MLYEPTNVTPSVITQTGTVASADNVNIEWQLNGNSAMTMFQIDVMQNNADSTFAYSSGLITNNPTGGAYSLPFIGKDRLGNYIPFVYAPGTSWTAWSNNEITDGNNYKFKIIQFYGETSVACKDVITETISANSLYWFSYAVGSVTYYVSFMGLNNTTFASGNTIYYDFTHKRGWVRSATGSQNIIVDITFSLTTEKPVSGTELNPPVAVDSNDVFYNQFFTEQNAPASFITRSAPEVSINAVTSPVTSATMEFSATYSQAQGDAISTVRWQLYNADSMSTPIDDTGDIFTSVLEYEYNGLFDGQSYTVVCTVTTMNNVSVNDSEDFSVQYVQNTYTGQFTAQCLCREDANLLEWDGLVSISGKDSPTGTAVVDDGQLSLPAGSTVTWDEQMNEQGELNPLNFTAPWTAVWSGVLPEIEINYKSNILKSGQLLNARVECLAFSPDGLYLVVCGQFSGRASVFTVDGTSFTYKNDLLDENNNPLNGDIHTVEFNTDGTILAIAGNMDGYDIKLYSVENGNFTYKNGMNPPTDSSYRPTIYSSAFSKDNLYVVGGSLSKVSGLGSSHFGVIYTVTNQNDTIDYAYIGALLNQNGDDDLDFVPHSATFSSNGEILVLGGTSGSSSFNAVYRVNETEFAFVGTLVDDSNYSISFSAASFSPDGRFFVAKNHVYRVIDNLFTYMGDLASPHTWDNVNALSFSPDGQGLILCGGSLTWGDGVYLSLYNFQNSPEAFVYVKDISINGQAFNDVIQDLNFSPDGEVLVCGGNFTQRCIAYTIDTASIDEVFSVNNSIAVSIKNESININNQPKMQLIGNPYYTRVLTLALNQFSLYQFVFWLNEASSNNVESGTSQQTITSVQLGGEQTCNYFAIIEGNGAEIISELATPDFVPVWNDSSYTVDLMADFQAGLEGGTGTSVGAGFRIYRQKKDGTEYKELATLPSTTISLKDYGIKSGEDYVYNFYVYDVNGAFMGVKTTEGTSLQRRFKRFSLLSTQYNESDGCYHVVKEYQFSCNIQDMAVSNNSNKSYVQNFTPYPTVFQSTANYSSGTLQALIGFVDAQTYKYWDSTQLMDELNALSTTANTLFLKDMKGHLWMVDVGTVQMTPTQKTKEMQVTISLPWTEIGNADNVSIIQTPNDTGWNNDAQVLDVIFDININTGMLEVTYPDRYYGTIFSLVENSLTAQTPTGVTPAQFTVSPTLNDPDDGQITATLVELESEPATITLTEPEQ